MCPNEQNQIFRTGNEQILYGSTKFLQNEQVKGANLLKTSKNRHSVQEKTQSCTKRKKPGVSYRKRANPVRNGETEWQSNEAETLWHRRWPYAKASDYSPFRSQQQNGYVLSKNVTKLGGRHWNMKKLCPEKAKFFR